MVAPMGAMASRFGCGRRAGASGGEGAAHAHANFSFFTGVSFTVNYIMGCGFLGLPQAFQKSGVLLGPLVVISFAFLMNVTKDFMLEAMGRTESLAQIKDDLTGEGPAGKSAAGAGASGSQAGPGAAGGGSSAHAPLSPDRGSSVNASSAAADSPEGAPPGSPAYLLCRRRSDSLGAVLSGEAPPLGSDSPGYALLSHARSRQGSAAVAGSAAGAASRALLSAPGEAAYLVCHQRKFEVADLFAVLLGQRARMVYVVTLSAYMYGALIAYGRVFAASFAANVPVAFANGGDTCNIEASGITPEQLHACFGPFFTWLAVFALLAIPLACVELKEQVSVQVAMFAARLLVVLLMTISIFAAWGCDGVAFTDPATPRGPPQVSELTLASPAGLSTLFPVSTYAFIFHHSVPILAQPIADKRSLPRLFMAAFAVCCAAYAAIGLIVALGFGPAINSQANLNWQTYVGCVAEGETSPTPVAAAVRFVILIFPALDVLSAYPLNAITLGNNLMAACLGDAAGVILSHGLDEEALEAAGRKHWYLRTKRSRLFVRTAFRLLAAVPPLLAVIGATVRAVDLETILNFTGMVGVGIGFAIPAMLRAAAWARTLALFSARPDAREAPAASGSVLLPGGVEAEAAVVSLGGADEATGLLGGASAGPAAASSLLLALRRRLTWRELVSEPSTKGSSPAVPPTLRAALLHTPYTSRAVRWMRGDLAMMVAAVAAALYILIEQVKALA